MARNIQRKEADTERVKPGEALIQAQASDPRSHLLLTVLSGEIVRACFWQGQFDLLPVQFIRDLGKKPIIIVAGTIVKEYSVRSTIKGRPGEAAVNGETGWGEDELTSGHFDFRLGGFGSSLLYKEETEEV
ncbi:hypothetical protein CCACVL1_18212 [Corchorus capsularis]|uniref:Uncharacterized protein n=1 Tax=Corchorus capsularis TaxID=210143 RepID=A0A1R3HM06_COCAP|nr:hypothetical protein CCACVL1_18212 [Corchorus capsularis]